jgi:hypothetical protein
VNSADGPLPLHHVMPHHRHEQDEDRGSDPDEHDYAFLGRTV